MITRNHYSFTIDTPEERGTVQVDAKLSRTYSVNGRISGWLLHGTLKQGKKIVRIHRTIHGMNNAYGVLNEMYAERARRLGVA